MNSSEYLMLLLALFISCFFLVVEVKKFFRKNGKLPSGPTRLPFFGNYLQLRNKEYAKTISNFHKKYGDVCTIYLGSQPVILVTGYQAVKEVLVDRGDDFLARGELAAFDSSYKNYGLAFTSNINRWRELQRFSISVLRDFGMGKKSIEERILEEAACLVRELKRMKGPSDNVIFSIMFGYRQDYDDEELLNVLKYIHEVAAIICSPWGQLYEMLPRFVPGPHQMIFKYMEKLLLFVEKRIKVNKKTLDADNPRDYVDAFLIKMEKEKMTPLSEYTLRNLVCSTLQIFFAGVETMSSTLAYSFLIMMKYPDILAKVHEELDRVIGRNRSPKLQDRIQMPYTCHVIHEMQRCIDLLPLGMPRKTTRDINFRGYSIPKDTCVFPILSSVLKDPSCFPFPTQFNPQNFLDEKGEFKKNDASMPLAAGKRNCLGEALVRMELYLFIVTVLQNFTLKSPVPIEELDITPVYGLGNLPKPYTISFIPRFT
ncbi:cytochrome P450 2G1-like [Pelobates fuscus]|uniref:cytochrome P450 2G1-like n=1 Tax=Pelobates fuscus TaxID=191477 RepID=UPI002FE4A70C